MVGFHSRFTGLRGMVFDVFAMRELFDRHIYHQVNGKYPNEPQYKQIRDSGHAGGDFIFARISPQTAVK